MRGGLWVGLLPSLTGGLPVSGGYLHGASAQAPVENMV